MVAGLMEIAARARQAEFFTANAQVGQAVAGYLTVVAPVDGRSEYQLIGLLSAVHTLAASPRWHRGIQVAWGNSTLLPDSLGIAPLDSTTRIQLSDPGGTARVRRAGRSVALVPLLDRNLAQPIGWVAAWSMLASERKSAVRLSLLALIAVAAGPALLLPARLLPRRTRWWLVVMAAGGAILLAIHEDHLVLELRARREAVVVERARLLADRAITMPRIDKTQLRRIEVRSGSTTPGWSLERKLAVGTGVFLLCLGLGVWSQTRAKVAEIR